MGVVSPGSVVEREAVLAGASVLERLGLRVRLGRSVFARQGLFAGSDEARWRDLAAMIEDDEVRAIHFARGGWGSSRFATSLPWRRLAARPKLLIGYSDLTSIFAPALDRAGLVCIYGPHVAELGDPRSYDRVSLLRAYFHPLRPFSLRFGPRQVLVSGRGSGAAAGGCLSLLAHMTGTPLAPDLRGRVLLIEDVSEPPYRIDRMLTQMDLAGSLDALAGVLAGSLTNCDPTPRSSSSITARRVIESRFGDLGIPVVTGLRFGHTGRKLSLPLGVRVRIDTARGRVVFEP